jgi:hypothetical protein
MDAWLSPERRRGRNPYVKKESMECSCWAEENRDPPPGLTTYIGLLFTVRKQRLIRMK